MERLVSDPAENIYAWPGDVLTLVKIPQTFSVFGATGLNTQVSFNAQPVGMEGTRETDSPLERMRFEPLVPLETRWSVDRLCWRISQHRMESACKRGGQAGRGEPRVKAAKFGDPSDPRERGICVAARQSIAICEARHGCCLTVNCATQSRWVSHCLTWCFWSR